MLLLRNAADSLAVSDETECSRTIASPSVGVSSKPMMFSRVVLPDPLGPTSPRNSPRSMVRLIPFSAVKWPSPTGNCFTRPVNRMIFSFSLIVLNLLFCILFGCKYTKILYYSKYSILFSSKKIIILYRYILVGHF